MCVCVEGGGGGVTLFDTNLTVKFGNQGTVYRKQEGHSKLGVKCCYRKLNIFVAYVNYDLSYDLGVALMT